LELLYIVVCRVLLDRQFRFPFLTTEPMFHFQPLLTTSYA